MSELHPDTSTSLASSHLLEAVNSFNSEKWYLAHDLFEELWHQSSGDFRELLQAIIQISVAEYHLENGNTRGAILLMAEGLNHLLATASLRVGYDLVFLRDLVRERLSALQNQKDPSALPKPYLNSI